MSKTTNETKLTEARARYEAAKASKDHDATIKAWDELVVLSVSIHGPQRRSGYASRAGKRQTAERRAMRGGSR